LNRKSQIKKKKTTNISVSKLSWAWWQQWNLWANAEVSQAKSAE